MRRPFLCTSICIKKQIVENLTYQIQNMTLKTKSQDDVLALKAALQNWINREHMSPIRTLIG
jgi:hypothetical protein